ncbi:MAG: DUF4367 domain-containing protein, partial [Oscillospiraceae bacterium]|nr:DUF4367 domain-containing protein [Oscillospiraceae bacterium]
MRHRISDLIGDMAWELGAGDIDLRDPEITDPERIIALVNGRSPERETPEASAPGGRKKRRGRRTGRTLLIAAVIILTMTMAAAGIYQYSIRDAEMAVVSRTYREDETGQSVLTTETVSTMSVNGFVDSPEYQAYQEWTEWNEAWWAENQDIFNELGVDDSYSEMPENYAYLYGAYFQEQVDKLDEIAEKYGLTLHTFRELFYTESQLCEALGTEDLFSGRLGEGSGYYYDDGSFSIAVDIDGTEEYVSCYNAVVGSFAMISRNMPAEYEEWSYTTSEGIQVILAVAEGDDVSYIVAGLDGSYFSACVSVAMEREELEALAEEIDLAALNDCFATEEARAETAAAVAACTEGLATATDTDNKDETTDEAIAYLGDWYLTGLEDGRLYRMTSNVPGPEGEYYWVSREYESDTGGTVTLTYRELAYTDSCTQEERLALETYSDQYLGLLETDDTAVLEYCTVNGYEGAMVVWDYGSYMSISLYWVDRERQVLFRLSTSGSMGREETIALAESVDGTAPDTAPGREAPSEEQLAQWAAEREIMLAQAAEEAADYVVTTALGDYCITAPPEGFVYANGLATSDTVTWEDETYEKVTERRYYFSEEQMYDADRGMEVLLSWCRYYKEGVALDTETAFALRQAQSEGGGTLSWMDLGEVTACTVNGYEAYYVDTDDGVTDSTTLIWADTDRELVFTLTVSAYPEGAARYTMEELT